MIARFLRSIALPVAMVKRLPSHLHWLRLFAIALCFNLDEWQKAQSAPILISPIKLRSIARLPDGQLIGAGAAGVFKSADEGGTWRKLDFPSQGRAGTGVSEHPAISVGSGIVFIGILDDGIWMSRDSGANWTSTGPVNNSFGTGASAIGFNGQDFVAGYFGWPRGIYRWNGSSWDKTDSANFDGNDLKVGMNGRFLVARFNGGGVVSSDDGGQTWTSRLHQTSVLAVEGSLIYALDISSKQLRLSSDNGATWAEVGDPIPALNGDQLIWRMVRQQGTLYAGVYQSGLWARPDGGEWQRLSTNSSVVFPFLIDGRVFICTDEGLYGLSGAANARVATAVAQVVNGFVVGATITDGGSGYTNAPLVTIAGDGGGALAVATVVNGAVSSLKITNPGSGYSSATITMAPPPLPPRRSTGTSQIINGFVVGVSITDGGFGYEAAPVVLLSGGGGSGATAVATVLNGVVTAINVTNPGTGYTSAPRVGIASPPFSPRVAIVVSKVKVQLSVVLGRKYQLEASFDLKSWTPTDIPFVSQAEELVQEFDVEAVGRYFRITQLP